MTIPIKYTFSCLVANYSLGMTIPLNRGINYVFQLKKKPTLLFFTQTQLKKKKEKLNELCGVVGHPITEHRGWSNQTWCCGQDHPRSPLGMVTCTTPGAHRVSSSSGLGGGAPRVLFPQDSFIFLGILGKKKIFDK